MWYQVTGTSQQDESFIYDYVLFYLCYYVLFMIIIMIFMKGYFTGTFLSILQFVKQIYLTAQRSAETKKPPVNAMYKPSEIKTYTQEHLMNSLTVSVDLSWFVNIKLNEIVMSSTSLFHSNENGGATHELQTNNIYTYKRFTV